MSAFKFPRTYHLPYSPGMGSDDKIIKSLDQFEGKNVVVTIKKDGENTSFYNWGMHARSMDSQHNYTRDWCKKLQSIICHEIPDGWRLCGENMAYYHSIEYTDLEGFFYLLSVWDDKNNCLSWDDTKEWAQLLDLPQPEIVYEGMFDFDAIKNLSKSLDFTKEEGYVMRIKESFHYGQYSDFVVKYVRSNHIANPAKFWLKETYPNKLKNGVCKPYYMK